MRNLHLIIFLFIKNLYNKVIQRWVAGTKTICMLAYAFTLVHHSLLKLKKYEGLVYNKDQTIAENDIKDLTSNMKVNNWSKTSDRDH